MKAVLVAVCLFCLILGLATFGLFRVNDYYKNLDQILEVAVLYMQEDEMEKAKEKVIEFSETWEVYDFSLTLFLRHAILDEIEINSKKLLGFLDYGDKRELIAELSNLRGLLHIMWDNEQLLIKNIF